MIGLFTKYELFRFQVADEVSHFTSGAKAVTLDDIVYIPKVINRSDIESSADMEKNEVKLTFPITDEFAQDLQGDFLERTSFVEIFEKKKGLTRFLWRGRLTKISPSDKEIELVFESEYTELQAMGNRLRYQRTCPHVVYQAGCNLNKDDFAVRTTAVSYNLLDLVVRNNEVDGFFNLGMITNDKGRLIGIETQNGGQLKLMNISSFTTISNADLVIAEALVVQLTEERNFAQSDYDQSVIDYDSAVLDFADKTQAYNDAVAYLDSLDPSDPDYANAEQAVADALIAKNQSEQSMLDAETLMNSKLEILNQAEIDLQDAIDAIPYIYMYAGCNKLNTTCKYKFNNLHNFGGFPYIPVNDPTGRSGV